MTIEDDLLEEWQEVVANGETILGYQDWLSSKIKGRNVTEAIDWERVLDLMDQEGVEYYCLHYESPSYFDSDPEVKEAFMAVEGVVTKFERLVKSRAVLAGVDLLDR